MTQTPILSAGGALQHGGALHSGDHLLRLRTHPGLYLGLPGGQAGASLQSHAFLFV